MGLLENYARDGGYLMDFIMKPSREVQSPLPRKYSISNIGDNGEFVVWDT